MKVLAAAAMQELDRRTILEAGIPGTELMENAGRRVAETVAQRFPALHPGPVLILCGRGNNGGDGFVIARHLHAAGWAVHVILLAGRGMLAGDAAVMADQFEQAGGRICAAPDTATLTAALAAAAGCRLCIDALLGTGFARAPEGPMAAAIDWLNTRPAPVVAVDLPSGVDASTGRVSGVAVRAARTVTAQGIAETSRSAVHPAGRKAGTSKVRAETAWAAPHASHARAPGSAETAKWASARATRFLPTRIGS